MNVPGMQLTWEHSLFEGRPNQTGGSLGKMQLSHKEAMTWICFISFLPDKAPDPIAGCRPTRRRRTRRRCLLKLVECLPAGFLVAIAIQLRSCMVGRTMPIDARSSDKRWLHWSWESSQTCCAIRYVLTSTDQMEFLIIRWAVLLIF